MRRQIKEFIGICARTLDLQGPIYEFGSRQMDGQVGYSDLRPFFPNHSYVGADYIAGPGVDVVLDLRKINLPDRIINTAFCLEVLEHVDDPTKAVQELHRVMTDDGLLIVSVPMNIKIHGSPYDYWRFTPEGLDTLLKLFPHRFVGYVGRDDYPDNIVAVVSKSALDLQRFAPENEQWKKRWRPTWYVVQQTTAPFRRILLPRILTGDELELWLRRKSDPHYPTVKNFIRLLVPPWISLLLKRREPTSQAKNP